MSQGTVVMHLQRCSFLARAHRLAISHSSTDESDVTVQRYSARTSRCEHICVGSRRFMAVRDYDAQMMLCGKAYSEVVRHNVRQLIDVTVVRPTTRTLLRGPAGTGAHLRPLVAACARLPPLRRPPSSSLLHPHRPSSA